MDKEKTKKIAGYVSFGLGALAFVVVLLTMWLPVIRIVLPGNTDPYYSFATGQNFVGWQVTFYDFGTIRPIVADRQAFNFNITMCLGLILPLLSLLICTLMLRKAAGVKKIVLEGISAAMLIFYGIVMLCACGLIEKTAGNLVLDTLLAAKKQGGYTLGWYAVFGAVVAFIIAACKIAAAVFTVLGGKNTVKGEDDK